MGQSHWSTVEFHQQEIFLDIGTIWTIQDLGLSGIVDYERFGGNPHRHYVRRDTRKIVDYLTAQLSNFTNANRPSSQRIPAGQIFGGSGDGKSTECWGWFHNVPYNRMWIHNESKTNVVFTIVKVSQDFLGNWIWKRQVAESFEAVKTELKSANIRVAVFDGTFQKDPMNCFAQICSEKNIFHVTCTSGQSAPLTTARASQFFFGNAFIVEGFTRDEYLAAEGFLHPDRTVDDIHRMYYFAGGSARYFFQYFDCIGDLCILFRSKIRRISNYTAFFSGAVGDSSTDAVNSLTTYRNGDTEARAVLVSKFVARLLSESADMNFINAAKDVLPDNASWQGWCTELDFFIRVRSQKRHSLNLVLKNNSTDPIVFDHPVRSIKKFNDLREILPADLAGHSAHQVLFIPQIYWNRGYDAIFISYNRQLEAVHVIIEVLQITVASSHTKKLESTALFLQRLFPIETLQNNTMFASFKVFYKIVTPMTNFDEFDLSKKSLSGVEAIQTWDPTFSFPDSFGVTYYDGDIAFIGNRRRRSSDT